MNPFIDVAYSGNMQTYTAKPVYQYDHGYILRLSGINESSVVQVHYAIPGMRGAIQDFAVCEDAVWTSKIPSSLLAQPREIQVFVYITSEEMGQTILKIIIPVIERPRPADYAYTEDELRGLEYVLSELNTAMNLVGELNEKTVAAAAAATDAANAANAVANFEVSASSIDHQQVAWAAVETVDGVKHIRFGIPKGEPGVSVSHKWNGSILTFTSASGTTSIDLSGINSGGGEGGGNALPLGGTTGQTLIVNENGEAVWTTLTPDSIGAQPKGTYLTEESDPNVPEWARAAERPKYTAEDVGALPITYTPPDQTAEQVGADPVGTAQSLVSSHNTNSESHNDLRLALKDLSERLDAFFDSDDKTLDELSELVAYIKNNKTLIDGITANKVNVSDIVDNLTTNLANRPLSAAQGVALKALIDAIKVPTALSELSEDSTHRTVTDAEKDAWNTRSDFSGDYNDLKNKPEIPTVPTNVSAFTNDAGYLTQHQDISGKLDANKLPEAINSALEQAKASGEFDGEDGDPGKSPTISTSKSGKTTTITIVDVDGTKTATIVDGTDGQPGEPGQSITVKSVSESSEDGGSNVVTFSDGNTLTVKNGGKGSQGEPGKDANVTSENIASALGYTPAKQEDVSQLSSEIANQQKEIDNKQPKGSYLTSVPSEYVTDTELNNKGYAIASSLTLDVGSDGRVYLFVNGSPQGNGLEIKADVVAGDVVGFVDNNNNIIITGALADGMYTIAYENADGKTTQIGTLNIGDGRLVNVNLIPLSINTDGTPYVGADGEDGYKSGYRLNSSGTETQKTNMYVTGFMPVETGDKVVLDNVGWSAYDGSNNYHCYLTLYDESFATLGYTTADQFKASATTISGLVSNGVFATDTTVGNGSHLRSFVITKENTKYLRMSATAILASSSIMVAE